MMVIKSPGIRGFTLVELMVTVAVIGVLSSIAVPSYKKYVAKSKWAEAKLGLAAYYQAQKVAFAEWGTFVECVNIFGFPMGDGVTDPPEAYKSYYGIGVEQVGAWVDGNATWGNTYVRSNGGPASCAKAQTWAYRLGRKICNGLGYDASCHDHQIYEFTDYGIITQNNFIAVAAGILRPYDSMLASPNDMLKFDTWSIDHNKTFLHIRTVY
jgi:prepilin-type N-terminal cleavage/methylation domain-containing protein